MLTNTVVTNAKGQTVQTIDVGIEDGKSQAILSLFGRMTSSASNWKPASTVLLISNPGWRPNSRLTMRARTQVEMDPDIGEAEWLRKHAQRSNMPVNEEFPEHRQSCQLVSY